MARQTKAQRRAEKAREAEERRRRQTRRKAIRVGGGGLATVVLVALFLISIWPEPAVGDTTSEAWNLPELDGDGRVTLADFEGKPTVVAFFASWCTVCEHEIPELLALSEEIGDEVKSASDPARVGHVEQRQDFLVWSLSRNMESHGILVRAGAEHRWPIEYPALNL